MQASTSRLEVMNKLQEYLLAKHSAGQHVVVFIEEAQSMPVATLEEIRLLSNLETQQNKLLQIVLFGQPELDEIISQREIRQLKERITYSFQLNPFTADDIRDYLNARLRACGYRSGEIFNGKATHLIERYSVGLVRRINILADKSMLAAFASNSNSVDAGHVRKAARDSEFVSDWRRKYWLPVLIVSMLAVIGVLIGWQINRDRETGDATSASIVDQQGARAATDAAAMQGTIAGKLPEQRDNTDSEQVIVNTNKQNLSGVIPDETGSDQEKSATVNDATTEHSPLIRQDGQSAGNNDVIIGSNENNTVKGPVDALPGPGVEEPPEITGTEAHATGPEAQLMGLDGIFGPGEMGSEQYTDRELQIMRAQLEKLPPEVAFHIKPSSDSDACKLCWSIIYWPLSNAGNL